MGLEADVAPQTKSPELVISQAQSLTKKYLETKELLQLQELKKRNMQAQLGLSLSHLSIKEPHLSDPQKSSTLERPLPEPVQKTVSFVLHDSADRIQELEKLISGKPLTLKGLLKLLRSHSCSQEITEQGGFQKLLEAWKNQQELENETMKKSLAKAGESIRNYEARLLTMEDMVGKVQKQKLESLKTTYGPLSKIEDHSEMNEMTIGMLSQRVELLTSENGALNQRYQEIVNQLTEADREIDRLKAELISLQSGKQHLLIMEELNRTKAKLVENQANAIDREYYERELNEKSLRLHEALVTLEELGNSLKDTEKRLQLKEATLKGLGFQTAVNDDDDESVREKEQLKELLEASEAKLIERETVLQSTEQHCVELQVQNGELIARIQDSERTSSQKLSEAEDEIRMLKEMFEVEMKAGRGDKTVHASEEVIQTGERQVADEGVIKQVVDEIEMKSEALNRVLKMLAKVDVNVEKMLSDLKSTLLITDCLGSSKEEQYDVRQRVMKRLVLEGEFWSQMLSAVEESPDENDGEKKQGFERRVAERMMAETSVLLWISRSCPPETMEVDSEMAETEPSLLDLYSWLDNETNTCILKDLTETLEEKAYLLKQIAATIKLSTDDKLLSLVLASFDSGSQQKQWSEYLLGAFREAYMSYLTIRLKFQHEKEQKQKQSEIQIGNSDCANCFKLRDLTRDLQSKLEDLQHQLSEVPKREDIGPVTHIQIEGEPIDSLDKTIELQDMIARHRKELREVKDGYEQEAEKLRQEVATASETLRLRSEENVKEIDSLTVCMENLKKKYELERSVLLEKFDREMEELRSVVTPISPERDSVDGANDGSMCSASSPSNLKGRIQELVTQVSVMTEEMRRREQQGDATTLRLKYRKDLENLKVEALPCPCCPPSVMPCVPLWHSQIPPPSPTPPLLPILAHLTSLLLVLYTSFLQCCMITNPL